MSSADCGSEAGGDVSLKACTSCKLVKYCNVKCQRNHWPTHKKVCKQRASELHDEALFKDPPAKEDCPICFLPMPAEFIACTTLPPATISSVPIFDFAEANKEIDGKATETYYPCCGKSICQGCLYSFCESGNIGICPFCNARTGGKTEVEQVEGLMKRVEVNDARAMYVLGSYYSQGSGGLQQDRTKANELFVRAADLDYSKAHFSLGLYYRAGGDLKKAKFHYEAAAMAGNEGARCNIGAIEAESGKRERAVKHWIIAASAGEYNAMHNLLGDFEQGLVSRDTFDSALTAYNNSCAEMISEARDAAIRMIMGNN